jgi:SpoVK/Ycf46/Vps4 family AAA+-type ATPase
MDTSKQAVFEDVQPVAGGTDYFATSLEHILAELERLDLLIRAQVARVRELSEGDHEFQGLCISEEEVNALLVRPAGLPEWAAGDAASPASGLRHGLDGLVADIKRRKIESRRCGVTLRLDELARLFRLTSFDVDVLLVCLAPELDLRYERLYAYLQDDVTKKRPSVDLVLNLLCPTFEAKLAARQRFADGAPLLDQRLVHLFDDPSHHRPPLLSRYLKLDDRVVNYLLDDDRLDARLEAYAGAIPPRATVEALPLPVDIKQRLTLLARDGRCREKATVLLFQGPYGVGKQAAAEALCRELGLGLLTVDLNRSAKGEQSEFETIVGLAVREALLSGAALYWDGIDVVFGDGKEAWRDALLRWLAGYPGMSFLAGETAWEPANSLREIGFVRIEFRRPDAAERTRLWTEALNGDLAEATGPAGTAVDPRELAGKFRFTGGQIRDAAASARNLARWRNPEDARVTNDDLNAACRLHCNQKLATLARKISPRYGWDDIVLPADQRRRLREICNHVKYRSVVYEQWGFGRKVALGKGLNVLFSGPPGTGKTMAADIIAGALALDLYKIDLSSVVSKYIGETEKNLAKIFAEAESSNAILFFDEADALFGRRSEVRDAHDRYANIEISYLLQRVEEYEGVVILATNRNKDMDEAFVRRLHFSIEFPFPAEADRRRIWQGIWPNETPLSPDLDLDLMARRFEIPGGNIRNIAVAAAFLAADDGGAITTSHLLRAIRREYQKMGKVVAEDEFGGAD